MPKIDPYLKKMHEIGGSDLHLESGIPPKVRIFGKLTPMADKPSDGAVVGAALRELLTDLEWEMYTEKKDLDFAYELPGVARFRVNCHMTQLGPGAVFRLVPQEILSTADLGLPAEILRYCDLKSGLVLVAGPTSSGKSTTLAALVDCINTNNQKHIVTIEEPVEFVHKPKKSHITHRQVGADTESFAAALRGASRENADVIVVSELRDEETIRLAIGAAEAGALVFGAMQTNGAVKAIERLVNAFQESEQAQLRVLLSTTLKGVCAQVLMPRIDGKGRVSASELLFLSFALSNMIREGNLSKINSLIEAGRGDGMISMDESIMGRFKEGAITAATAHLYAAQKSRFDPLLKS